MEHKEERSWEMERQLKCLGPGTEAEEELELDAEFENIQEDEGTAGL